MKTVKFTVTLTEEQNRKLNLLSETSLLSKAALVREGVNSLFSPSAVISEQVNLPRIYNRSHSVITKG